MSIYSCPPNPTPSMNKEEVKIESFCCGAPIEGTQSTLACVCTKCGKLCLYPTPPSSEAGGEKCIHELEHICTSDCGNTKDCILCPHRMCSECDGHFCEVCDRTTPVPSQGEGPTVIKSFPGKAVDAYLKKHGRLPSEEPGQLILAQAKARKEVVEKIINDLETNPNLDGSVSPNIQHWIEQKQTQLKVKYLKS